jgi:hypothetical protein
LQLQLDAAFELILLRQDGGQVCPERDFAGEVFAPAPGGADVVEAIARDDAAAE